MPHHCMQQTYRDEGLPPQLMHSEHVVIDMWINSLEWAELFILSSKDYNLLYTHNAPLDVTDYEVHWVTALVACPRLWLSGVTYDEWMDMSEQMQRRELGVCQV